jgi:transcriptional regulator with XRE-family HTH domain
VPYISYPFLLIVNYLLSFIEEEEGLAGAACRRAGKVRPPFSGIAAVRSAGTRLGVIVSIMYHTIYGLCCRRKEKVVVCFHDTIMRNWTKRRIRERRQILSQTQAEFAAMIGASKDAVASWETGRNRLSRQFARRIGLATGVEEGALLRGRGRLRRYVPFAGRQAFTAAQFEQYRKSYWGRSEEAAARQHLRNCVEALELLFLAAARPHGKTRHRLSGVLDSFLQWCDRTREEFQLEPETQKLLEQRKAKLVIQHTYGEWRRMQKEDAGACRLMGFTEDAAKSDKENLRLEAETVPIWRPGHSMRGDQALRCCFAEVTKLSAQREPKEAALS